MHTATIITSVLGAAQGFFFSALLFDIRKVGSRANRHLAAMILLLSMTLLVAFLHFNDLIERVPHLLGITQYFTLLYGPLLLFYVSKALDQDYEVGWKSWLHFLPFLFLLAEGLPFLTAGVPKRLGYTANIFVDRFRPKLEPASIIPILHFLLYLIISSRKYFLTSKMAGRPAKRHRIKFHWIRNILCVSGLVWGTYLVFYFVSLDGLNKVLPILLTASIYAIGYAGFKRPELFRDGSNHQLRRRYESSRLTPAEKKEHRENLLRIMNDQKPYTKMDLSLSRLVGFTALSTHELSQIINEEFHQNFSDFVNSFRVQARQPAAPRSGKTAPNCYCPGLRSRIQLKIGLLYRVQEVHRAYAISVREGPCSSRQVDAARIVRGDYSL
jgi:hypothetical protein